MTNLQALSFEEKILLVTRTPEPSPEFADALWHQIREKQPQPLPHSGRSRLTLRPAQIVLVIFLIAITALFIGYGPQRVYAAVKQFFAGYIPGVGIVDQSSPIRVLEEPVTVTRDDISITVTSATLTGERTYIDYRSFGIPGTAYPDREDQMGCIESEYLRLPDGTQLTRIDNDFQPVPAGVNEAVFVIPCIFNTLPGTLPEDWELPLRFVPAPPDLTVMPVIELSPSPESGPTGENTETLAKVSPTPEVLQDDSVTVSQVIETEDGYILVSQFQAPTLVEGWVQGTGMPEIRDADGKKVAYTIPQDIHPGGSGIGPNGAAWATQFKAAGLSYPLTITYPGVIILPADPNATTELTFDAGPDPQPGQEWELNQQIQLAGHTITLVSVSASSRGGYSFRFQGDPQVNGLGVEIVGYTPNGGGGGGGGLTHGTFSRSISFSQIPTGQLTVLFSNLTLVGDSLTWQGHWTPENPRTDLPASATLEPGVCLSADTLAQLSPAPAELLNGKALMYEQLDDTDQWGLVLYNLDGSEKQVLASNASWGSLSPDGSRMAYPREDGIHILDLDTKTEKVLTGANGFDLRWSLDGKRIAYIGMDDNTINSVFIMDVDGSQARQISEWSYELLVGWSPDGKLYFVAPYTGGAAWVVYSYDLSSGETAELFTIENGTAKALNATLSPDGEWIAYRGRDNSPMYLVHPDGSDMHLVLENTGAVGLEWSPSGWMGISLIVPYSNDRQVILLNPESCQAYLLPELHGEMEGLRLH